MEINRSNILDIVNNSNARPDKDYGQNFLVEPAVAKRIVDSAEIDNEDLVLEIGPGLGSLTHFIVLESTNATIVDIDERMIAFLQLIYKDQVKLVREDIRKFDVSSYQKVIANLPYNITTETIVYLLLNGISIKKMILMIQLDAYSHFQDVEGKEYGPASILLHLLGTPKKLFQVKPGSFYPAPKCDSVVFSIDINRVCEIDEAKRVYLFAKSMFLNRRKTILNNLKNYAKEVVKAEDVLNECGISLTARPENISPLDYLKLYRTYQKFVSK